MYDELSDSNNRFQLATQNGSTIPTFSVDSMNELMYCRETSSFKSWAQQTEESYQLQLALALRLSSQAASADDPYFLDFNPDNRRFSPLSDSAEAVSHRFWVNGCLSYFDIIPDGFYLIHGMDPYAWTISTDQEDIGRIPSFESLSAVGSCDDLPVEVIHIDKSRDAGLKELLNIVFCSRTTTEDMVDLLANIVSSRMGGAASTEEGSFSQRWKECAGALKDCLGSIILPIGSLSVGLCVHRALLFKVLADSVNLPCRIAIGCKYCRKDIASSCIVQFGVDREYLVDLFEKPGALSQPDSSVNGKSSILASSPLCHPRFKQVSASENFRTMAQSYFFDGQSLKHAFDEASPDGSIGQYSKTSPHFANASDMNMEMNNVASSSSTNHESSMSPPLQRSPYGNTHKRTQEMINSLNAIPNFFNYMHLTGGPTLPHYIQSLGQQHLIHSCGKRDDYLVSTFSNMRLDNINNLDFAEVNQPVVSRSNNETYIEEEDLEISWSELVLKEKIGAGSFGTVHRADWRGQDVAVKILMEQEFHAEWFREFLREVAIMKCLRHPNIVLFMGAVTQLPNLSIVTEYLSRGSLYKLLRMPDAGVKLDLKNRLCMACDVARGMNYLHQLKPPIVHRDLKSPNLLVDSTYTVKVCDFGLSRSKANTFLSSKTAAGTPEWMAPEVLRDEPSNEKSDVYSFGVILWELMTLQPPWRHLNASQVVAAVGFRGKRLQIPCDINPIIAALIESCWANDPSERPSFSCILETLQRLIY